MILNLLKVFTLEQVIADVVIIFLLIGIVRKK